MDDDDFKRTIYVGNLPDQVNQQMLFAFFNTFGQIKSIQIPIDHVTQKKRGFAFVQFDQKQDAASAIDNYDQTQFMDRTIRVKRSKPMHLKPNYHVPVWHNDDWLQDIQRRKLDNEKYTNEMQIKNKSLGLPVFKNMQRPEQQKQIVFNESD